ncbi:MAG TPA: phosphotransferase family protein [Acidimicrobiales bacterium]|nr:phosphotransferase family protein [Acidimicrobiales bacterium]
MTSDAVAGSLARLLARPVDAGAAEIRDLRRLTGGASRETWSFDAVHADGEVEPFVLQRARVAESQPALVTEAALLRAAAAAGVPVAELVASEGDEVLGAHVLVSRRVEGETIARRLLRDDEWAAARERLVAQCGAALGAVHRIPVDAVPDLPTDDQLARYRAVLHDFGDPHPVFELALRWLAARRPPPSPPVVVHGDFRLGNLLVGPDGLRAVLDWELAHLGDPVEDLGWLCVRAWRFGGPAPVAGLGTYDELLDAYAAASGRRVDPDHLRWWEVLGTLKWGIMCKVQAAAHLTGAARSVELAAIGRRVCENEHDLLELIA